MIRIDPRVIGPGVLVQDRSLDSDPKTCPIYTKSSARKALMDFARTAILPGDWPETILEERRRLLAIKASRLSEVRFRALCEAVALLESVVLFVRREG